MESNGNGNGLHYDAVRQPGGAGAPHAVYEIVKHEPGRADEVLARGARWPAASAIVRALNAAMRRQGNWK